MVINAPGFSGLINININATTIPPSRPPHVMPLITDVLPAASASNATYAAIKAVNVTTPSK